MAKQKTKRSPNVVRSSGNVFADLGFADADERQTKVRLAVAINEVLRRRGLSQAEAAGQLGINQPKVSALTKYRLEGFSVERLMRFLTSPTRTLKLSFAISHGLVAPEEFRDGRLIEVSGGVGVEAVALRRSGTCGASSARCSTRT